MEPKGKDFRVAIGAVRVHLHQASVSTMRQLCDDASDSDLIENNGVTPDWGCNPFSSDSLVLNENRIPTDITELTLTLSVNWP